MIAWLRRVLRKPPTIRDCINAARHAPCEPSRARDLPVRPVDRTRTPDRSPCPPVHILSWDAYDAWIAAHPEDPWGDAA